MCSLGIFMIGFATFDILFVRKAVPERCTSLFCEKYFHLKLLFIQPQHLWISRMIYSVLCLFHSSSWKDESNFLEKKDKGAGKFYKKWVPPRLYLLRMHEHQQEYHNLTSKSSIRKEWISKEKDAKWGHSIHKLKDTIQEKQCLGLRF